MRGARLAALAFVFSALASLALVVVYVTGGQPQLEGILLGIGLGGLGIGLVAWARNLMPSGPFVQARKVTLRQAAELEEVEESLDQSVATIGRRRFLGRLLAVSLGAFGVPHPVAGHPSGPRPLPHLVAQGLPGGHRHR